MKKNFNKKIFILTIVTITIVIFSQAIQLVKGWQGPPGTPPAGTFFQPLDTSSEPQTKKGILYFGTDNLPGAMSSGLVLGRNSGLCLEEEVNGALSYNCDALVFGGGYWLKNQETGDIFYDLGNVGIGTSNPRGILDVRSSRGIFFGTGPVSVGSSDNNALLNVYGNTHVKRIFIDDSTGFIYQMISSNEHVDVRADYNMENPSFNWWKAAFPDKFGDFSDGETGWREARISYERTMDECQDDNMARHFCWRSEPWPARPGSPEYVYDFTMFESGNRIGISFIEFELREVSINMGGGSTSAYDGRFSGSVGIGTDRPQSKLDVRGEIRVSNSGAACTSVNAGAIRFENEMFYGCNGTDWIPLIHEDKGWFRKANFRGKYRLGATSFSIGNVGYIGQGWDMSKRELLSDFWKYENNIWTQMADGGRRAYAVSFIVGNRAYAGTGFDRLTAAGILEPSYSFKSYNSQSGQWTNEEAIPSGSVGLTYAIAFSASGKGYVGIGWEKVQTTYRLTDVIWEFNPARGPGNKWEIVSVFGNFPGGFRDKAVAFSIGDKGYIGTGADFDGYKGDFWEFNTNTRQWSSIGSIPPRAHAVAFSIGDKGYIGTGRTTNNYLNDFWEFDLISQSWKRLENFPAGERANASAFSIGNRGYVGLGWNGSVLLKDFWEYNP